VSNEGLAIVRRVLSEVGECKYLYRSIVEGAIEACYENYGMAKPAEDNKVISDMVFSALNELNK